MIIEHGTGANFSSKNSLTINFLGKTAQGCGGGMYLADQCHLLHVSSITGTNTHACKAIAAYWVKTQPVTTYHPLKLL